MCVAHRSSVRWCLLGSAPRRAVCGWHVLECQAGGPGLQGEAGSLRKWLPLTLHPLHSEPSFSNRGFVGTFWAKATPHGGKPQFCVFSPLWLLTFLSAWSLRSSRSQCVLSVPGQGVNRRDPRRAGGGGRGHLGALGSGFRTSSPITTVPFSVSDTGLPHRICLKKGSCGSKEKV